MHSKLSPLLALFLVATTACTSADRDGDGFEAPVDCDDNAANIHPDAVDVPGNDLDEDCDGEDTPLPGYVGSWFAAEVLDVSGTTVEFNVFRDLSASTVLFIEGTTVTYRVEARGGLRDLSDDGFSFDWPADVVFPGAGVESTRLEGDCEQDDGGRLACFLDLPQFDATLDVFLLRD